jgi:ABC-type polysaccharide/polyol phosphate export permease
MLGPKFEFVLKFNPVYYPISATRAVMYDGVVPGMEVWGIGFAIAAGFLLLGLAVFTGTQDRFVYYA